MLLIDAVIIACFIACIATRHPIVRICAVCLLCTYICVRSAACCLGVVESFGNGDVLCKHVDNLDVDMPYDSHMRHFVFEDGRSLIDIMNCNDETFTRVVDSDTKAVKWQGPPSSSFLKTDSMSIFVTLDAEHELPLPGKEVSIFVARAEPADQLNDNSSMALIQMGIVSSPDGHPKLFGECGETRVELDYPLRTMPRVHFLTFTPDQVQVGFADVWDGTLEHVSKDRGGAHFNNTSSSPVVVNASSHRIGDIISVAVYDQSTTDYTDAVIQGISAHAMQGNTIFTDLLNKYRTSLANQKTG